MNKNTVFIIALLTMVCLAGSVNAADLRYKDNGPWQDVEGVGGITGHGCIIPTKYTPAKKLTRRGLLL